MELRDYQKKAVEWGNSHDVGYFAVDMSMGKTAILLHMIDRPTIIFAPLTVAAITWPEEIAKWRPDLKYQVLHGKTRYLQPGLDVYIINYDGINWLSKAWTIEMTNYMRDGMIIWDEMTKLKDSSSKRFKHMKDFRRLFKRAYALSGTPAPNGVRDLFSQYYLLDYGERLGKRKTRFMMTYHTQIDRFIWVENNGAMDIVTDKIKDITFRLDANDYLKLEPYIFHLFPRISLPHPCNDIKSSRQNLLRLLQMKVLLRQSLLEYSHYGYVSSYKVLSMTSSVTLYSIIPRKLIPSLNELKKLLGIPCLSPFSLEVNLSRLERDYHRRQLLLGALLPNCLSSTFMNGTKEISLYFSVTPIHYPTALIYSMAVTAYAGLDLLGHSKPINN